MSLARFKKRKEPPKPFLRAESANVLFAEQVADALGLGLTVQGQHVELANGMRGTYHGPRLVWCHKDGTGIGDNCALAIAVAGVPFRDALELLLGYAAANPLDYAPAPTARKVLRVPGTSADAEQSGREYLRGRGISDAALATAEACGMLRHIPGAVLFIGFDGKQPKSATRRGYGPVDPMPKRDLAGTDKAWPAILLGSLDTVWVVEGGVDALALHTLYPLDPPTVIVTGGAGCKAWLEQPHIVDRLERAQLVMVATEREKDGDTQAQTDTQHQAQAESIRRYCAEVVIWNPPPGIKDLAEMLAGAATPASGIST